MNAVWLWTRKVGRVREASGPGVDYETKTMSFQRHRYRSGDEVPCVIFACSYLTGDVRFFSGSSVHTQRALNEHGFTSVLMVSLLHQGRAE